MLEDITEDRLLDGRVKLLQPRQGYRVAIDPVLLAAAVPAVAGELVAELGSGTGAVALCLAARVAGLRVEGLEARADYAALAEESARRNRLDDRVGFRVGTVAEAAARLGRERFDHAVANPPYREAAAAAAVADPGRHAATIEGEALLADWIDAMLALARPGGTLTLIHRADRLADLLAALAGRAGDTRVFPLWPKAGQPAARIIVAARKGRRGRLTLGAGLVLHQADGAYTPAAMAILREGQPLTL